MDSLKKAIASEAESFEKAYLWLSEHMPPKFFKETDEETRIVIARNLLSFDLQNHFIAIQFEKKVIVLCDDGPDADLKVLKNYTHIAIRYYRAFVSNEPPPKGTKPLRIALLHSCEDQINDRFQSSMPKERFDRAMKLVAKAKTTDECQYELRKNEDWKKTGAPSLQLLLAWKNVPKAGFLYRLSKIIYHHHLSLQKVAAAYIDPYSTESVLVLSLGLHGVKGDAAWKESDIDDFLREIVLTKYFRVTDPIEATFTLPRLLTGNEAHLVRTMVSFVHQVLVYSDPNLYSYDNVIEGLCRHPELTVELCRMFQAKFEPNNCDLSRYESMRDDWLKLVDKLDTGQAVNDLRRKTILKQALSFIQHTLKTNFYRPNKSAFAFRLDPHYLDKEKFPETPYAVFFIRGMYFIGFNVRFKDLARGGVRTVIPERMETFLAERNTIFSEAYNLALTQQKKNKDIPEGGSKTAILLEPFEVFSKEEEIYKQEMGTEKLDVYRKEQKQAYLFASQRSFIESFMTLINCDETGKLLDKDVIDYWKRPEYIYLGPDENMFNDMLTWISSYAVACHYKPGRSFISGRPGGGINHKEVGVTSYGVNVYMEETLRFLGIDPKKTPFTVKISGGPDGDVAGNQILNLYKYYPKTAKLLALTDVSGTIYDPNGLDLKEMAELFHKVLPIRSYPPEKLSEGGFLLDLKTMRDESTYAKQTLCWRKKGNKLVQDWLSGNEMNHLYKTNVHHVITDVFVPGGGRPRTLNESNYTSYLNDSGKPTSKAIVEGANLYLTAGARRSLEKLGTLIMKDSSCNKGGVICSSFEVLASLCMSEEEFAKEKPQYVKEVLEIIRKAALNEARLLLDTHKNTGAFLTDISEKISEKINLFKYQLLEHFEATDLPKDPSHPLLKCLLAYCPPLIRTQYRKELFAIPEIHKKAVIAAYLGAHLVYTRGLDWSPTIAEVLPVILTLPIEEIPF